MCVLSINGSTSSLWHIAYVCKMLKHSPSLLNNGINKIDKITLVQQILTWLLKVLSYILPFQILDLQFKVVMINSIVTQFEPTPFMCLQ